MSNPERVEDDQNGYPLRRGHFVAAHIALYLITIGRFVVALYIYFIDRDTKYPLYFWILAILLPALPLVAL